MASTGVGAPLRDQIYQYLRFFYSKREAYLSEIVAVVRDVRDARLSEAVFSQDEVRSILEEASDALKESAAKELDKYAQMGALVLEQVFMSAAVAGVAVSIDLSKTEDERSLLEVGKMKRLDAAILGAAERAGKEELQKLSDEHRKLAEQFDEIQEKYRESEQDRERMQKQVGDLTRLGDSLQGEIDRAKSEAGSASAAAAQASLSVPEHARTELESLRARVAQLETDLEDSYSLGRGDLPDSSGQAAAAGGGRDAAEGAASTIVGSRVTYTKQFRMLKEMLARKNKQVIELRSRLRKYEPDDADAKDADAAGETPLQPKSSS